MAEIKSHQTMEKHGFLIAFLEELPSYLMCRVAVVRISPALPLPILSLVRFLHLQAILNAHLHSYRYIKEVTFCRSNNRHACSASESRCLMRIQGCNRITPAWLPSSALLTPVPIAARQPPPQHHTSPSSAQSRPQSSGTAPHHTCRNIKFAAPFHRQRRLNSCSAPPRNDAFTLLWVHHRKGHQKARNALCDEREGSA